MTLAIIMLLAYLPVTDAEPKSPDTLVCDVVRWYVDMYGEKAAREYVKDHKWSKERIASAENCIHNRK